MENIYANLFAPEAKVCGTWLRRYTLWNHALLSAFRSPLLSRDPGASLTAGDLLFHVELCRVRYPELPRTRPRLSRAHWHALLCSPIMLRLQCEILATWIASHTHGPLFWRDTSNSGPGLTAPEIYSMVYGLTAKAGLTQQEAWDTSPGQAETIIATVAELEGAEIHFADPAELTPENEPVQPTTRDEIYQRAVQDLGPSRAEKFMERWDKANRN